MIWTEEFHLHYFKIASLIYKVFNSMLPDCIQRLFQIRECHYELRGSCIFTRPKSRTTVKERSVLVYGVKLWNELEIDLKKCNTINRLKKLFKYKVINKYKTEVWIPEGAQNVLDFLCCTGVYSVYLVSVTLIVVWKNILLCKKGRCNKLWLQPTPFRSCLFLVSMYVWLLWVTGGRKN